ncbi:MAG: hypothetical protein ACR65R_04605 [Methylomicrobium sp.]|jgi:hypothetical protein
MEYCIDAPILEKPGYPEVLYIDKDSDESLKDHLAVIAKYFKNEMCFNRLQFDESMYDNNDFTGFLVLQPAMDLVEREDHFPCRVVGGGVFAHSCRGPELDWVWIHPFSRNRKLLRNRWKEFKARFGQFSVAEPLSAHMSAFLKKHHEVPNKPLEPTR